MPKHILGAYVYNINMEKLKLVMTGGGTGGHIVPNLALIPYLKKHFKIYYLGESGSMEQRLVSKDKEITFVEIPAVKLIRKLTPKNILVPYKLLKAVAFAKKVLQDIAPNVIFAKGGYVSLPVAMAGKKLNIPILAHESDYSMGLANKIIHRYAKVMFTSFRETCISDKCIYSGSPIRQEVFSANKEVAEKFCRFQTPKPTILFFGGSLGSKNINKFVFDNLDKMDSYNIIHFVGRGNAKETSLPNYCQIEFAENIYDFFALSDVVVCRAGANSIFELLAMQKPMLLIPLSKEASRGDQIENANVFKTQGFAEVLEEKDLSFENFSQKVSRLEKNKFFYTSNMKTYNGISANNLITKYILDYAKQK